MDIGNTTTFDALSPELRQFGLHLLEGLRADERLVGIWVIGSLASGVADAWSDLDFLVAVREEAFEPIVADWRGFLDGLTPTLDARKLGADDKPSIIAITPAWHRVDLTIVSVADPRPHGYTARPLYARDAAIPFAFIKRPAPPIAERLPTLIGGFLRTLGLLPVVIGRGELIVGLTPVGFLRDALIDLYLLENGAVRGGAKRLNALLTNEQRHSFETLPPLSPTAASIIANHAALARLFLPRARQLARAKAVDYPEQFEWATLDHLARLYGSEFALA